MSRRRSHYRCPSCGEKLVIYSINRRQAGEEIYSEISFMCEEIHGTKNRCDFLITLTLPTKDGKILWLSKSEFAETAQQFSQQAYVLSMKDTPGGMMEMDFEGPFINEVRANAHCQELISRFPDIYCWEDYLPEMVEEGGEEEGEVAEEYYAERIRLDIAFASDIPDQPFYHFCRRFKGLPELYSGSFHPYLIKDKKLRQIFQNAPKAEIVVCKED